MCVFWNVWNISILLDHLAAITYICLLFLFLIRTLALRKHIFFKPFSLAICFDYFAHTPFIHTINERTKKKQNVERNCENDEVYLIWAFWLYMLVSIHNWLAGLWPILKNEIVILLLNGNATFEKSSVKIVWCANANQINILPFLNPTNAKCTKCEPI